MTNFFSGMAAAGLIGILLFASALDSPAWILAGLGVMVSSAVLAAGAIAASHAADLEDFYGKK